MGKLIKQRSNKCNSPENYTTLRKALDMFVKLLEREDSERWIPVNRRFSGLGCRWQQEREKYGENKLPGHKQ